MGGAAGRGIAQQQRMGAGVPRLLQQPGGGFNGEFAVEQGRAQRAVGMGGHQRRQWNSAGAPQGDRRHQANQAPGAICFRGVAPGAERANPGAAGREGIYRKFPVGRVIAVRLHGAFGEFTPCLRGNGRKRRDRAARRRGAPLRALADAGFFCVRRRAAKFAISTTSPVSPFRAGSGGARGGARPLSSLSKLTERLENPVGKTIQFNRVVNPEFTLESPRGLARPKASGGVDGTAEWRRRGQRSRKRRFWTAGLPTMEGLNHRAGACDQSTPSSRGGSSCPAMLFVSRWFLRRCGLGGDRPCRKPGRAGHRAIAIPLRDAAAQSGQ